MGKTFELGDKENILGKRETFWKMETSGQRNLLDKGKPGKNFWKGNVLTMVNLRARETFLASGNLSGKWELL